MSVSIFPLAHLLLLTMALAGFGGPLIAGLYLMAKLNGRPG